MSTKIPGIMVHLCHILCDSLITYLLFHVSGFLPSSDSINKQEMTAKTYNLPRRSTKIREDDLAVVHITDLTALHAYIGLSLYAIRFPNPHSLGVARDDL